MGGVSRSALVRVVVAGLCAAWLAGCTSDAELVTGTAGFAPNANTSALPDSGADASTEVAAYDDNASYAGHSTYRCDNGETLDVENSVTQVAIAGADGAMMELPASPVDSHTRYVKDQYAFVLDGDEALYFRPKAAPATCKR